MLSNEVKLVDDNIILQFNAPLKNTEPDIDRFVVAQVKSVKKKRIRSRGRLTLLEASANQLDNTVVLKADRNVEILDNLVVSCSDNPYDQLAGVIEGQFGNDFKSISKQLLTNSYIGRVMGPKPEPIYSKID